MEFKVSEIYVLSDVYPGISASISPGLSRSNVTPVPERSEAVAGVLLCFFVISCLRFPIHGFILRLGIGSPWVSQRCADYLGVHSFATSSTGTASDTFFVVDNDSSSHVP